MSKRSWCVAALAGLLLTACGSSGGGADVEVDADTGVGVELESQEWTTEGLDRDATLKVGTTLQFVSADVHAAGTTVGTQYFNLLYDRLFWVTANSELRGYLAEEWEFVDKGLQLTLREGATFHDGSPVDAAAVKANLDRARSAEFSGWIKALSAIKDVEAVDDRTVLIHTAAKSGATLPYVLGGWAGMIMNPKFLDDPEALRTSAPEGIGSGPFKVAAWTPGENTVVMERVDGHWDPLAGQVAKVEFGVIPDSAQLMTAVSTGEFDLARITSETAVSARDKAKADSDNLQTGELVAANSIVGVWMRDLVDPKVREAISLTLDREAIVPLYQGGAQGTNQLFAEGHPAHADVDAYTQHDVAKAKELVKQAPSGSTSFTMAYVETGLDSRVAQLIQAQLADVGITIKLKPMTHSSIYSAWFQSKFEMVLMGNAGPSHASTGIDASLLRGGTSWGAPDSALAPIEAELAKADDPALADADRNAIYQGILTNVAKENWVVPFVQLRSIMFGAKKVVNIDPAAPFQYQSLEDIRYVGVLAD